MTMTAAVCEVTIAETRTMPQPSSSATVTTAATCSPTVVAASSLGCHVAATTTLTTPATATASGYLRAAANPRPADGARKATARGMQTSSATTAPVARRSPGSTTPGGAVRDRAMDSP